MNIKKEEGKAFYKYEKPWKVISSQVPESGDGEEQYDGDGGGAGEAEADHGQAAPSLLQHPGPFPGTHGAGWSLEPQLRLLEPI